MAKSVYGFAGRGAFDRNTRAMRAAERSVHAPGTNRPEAAFTPSVQPTRVVVEIRDQEIDDRRHLYPARMWFRNEASESPSDDWLLIGETDDDEQQNCLAATVSGEVLIVGRRYEGQMVGTFTHQDPDDPDDENKKKETPVVEIEVADGVDLVRVVSAVAAANGYYDAYFQQPGDGTPDLSDGERIWVKAYGNGDVAVTTYLATFVTRLPEGVEQGRAVYGVNVTAGVDCRAAFVGLDEEDCLAYRVPQTGTGVCVSVPSTPEYDMTWDAAGKFFKGKKKIKTGGGDADVEAYYDEDGNIQVRLKLGTYIKKMKQLNCTGGWLNFATFSSVFCTERWTKACTLCPDGAPKTWQFGFTGGQSTTGTPGPSTLNGQWKVFYSTGCTWVGQLTVSDIANLVLAYDPDDDTVVSTLTFLAANGDTLTYKMAGKPPCCGPMTFTLDEESAPTGVWPATLTVTAYGPCKHFACSQNLFFVQLRCKACPTWKPCTPYDPLPDRLCVNPITTLPSRPAPTANGMGVWSWPCSHGWDVTFLTPATVVHQAGDIDFVEGTDYPAQGIGGPGRYASFLTNHKMENSGYEHYWMGKGKMSIPVHGGEWAYGIELYFIPGNGGACGVRLRLWYPTFVQNDAFGILMSYASWVIDPTYGYQAEFPPFGAFPISIINGETYNGDPATNWPVLYGRKDCVNLLAPTNPTADPCPEAPLWAASCAGMTSTNDANWSVEKFEITASGCGGAEGGGGVPLFLPRPASMAATARIELPVRTPCRHEGAVTVPCPSTTGETAELRHIRECDVYGECTRGAPEKGRQVCLGCKDYEPDPALFRSSRPGVRVGLVIGEYRYPNLAVLNATVARDLNGPIPVLISSDDPDGDILELAERHDLHAFQVSTRRGHTAGDLMAVWRGLEWAASQNLHYLAKLSQSAIPLTPNWLHDGADALKESGLATATRRPAGAASYPVRSEMVLFEVAAWTRPEVLADLKGRTFKTGPDRELVAEQHLGEVIGRHFGGLFLPWEAVPPDRTQPDPKLIWHESHGAEVYRRLAAHHGRPLDADFRTDGWAWQQAAGEYIP